MIEGIWGGMVVWRGNGGGGWGMSLEERGGEGFSRGEGGKEGGEERKNLVEVLNGGRVNS